jgi:molybdopterin/thiamine biosynthesis adenylyltransferase
VVPRGGADDALGRKRLLVIGCGAVGSRVARELARAGILRLTLVDPDTLQMENVFRHELGLGAVGKGKAEALKAHLEEELPYVEVEAVGARIEDALADGTVEVAAYDLVVCALGSPTVEMDLNEGLWKVTGGPPVVFTWVEPYGIGGHALLMRPGQAGCFECLYTAPGEERSGLAQNRASFAGPPPPGRAYGKALSGCGSLFTPYGSADAAQSALLAVRLGVGALTRGVEGSPLLSWKGGDGAFIEEGFAVTGRYRKGQDLLDRERFGYVSTACPVCRETP